MSYKKRALTLAEKMGCTVIDEGTSLCCDFPKGYIDEHADVHGWVIGYDIGEKTDAWKWLIDDLKSTNLVPCTDPECCNHPKRARRIIATAFAHWKEKP